jgi:hypothetical protein
MCSPNDLTFDFVFEDKKITFDHKTIVDENGLPRKIFIPTPHTSEEMICKIITLQGDNNELLIKYVDTAKKYCEEKINLSKKSTNTTIKVNMWRKEYWNLLFKSPKRPLNTLYLKEGQKESLIKNIEEFYDVDTRGDYLSHGIPYKNVIMLYGPPGTGKTSTINTIASHFDANVYVIPISKELTDYGLIDAISTLEEKEDKKEEWKKKCREPLCATLPKSGRGNVVHQSAHTLPQEKLHSFVRANKSIHALIYVIVKLCAKLPIFRLKRATSKRLMFLIEGGFIGKYYKSWISKASIERSNSGCIASQMSISS